mmetsp:Transcript_93/g.251  ORF Transcript_93/g.251 Transcript_93/m.251 type:complete len:398 (+) Transcript_93:83-1276(+)
MQQREKATLAFKHSLPTEIVWLRVKAFLDVFDFTPLLVFRPFRWPVFAFTKSFEVWFHPRLQRPGVVDVHNLCGIYVVSGDLGGRIGQARIDRAAEGGNPFRRQPAEFGELSGVNPNGVFHDPPMVGTDTGFLDKIPVARGNGLRTGVPKVVFCADTQHRPVIEPFQFFVLEQFTKLMVEFFRVVASVVLLPHSVIKVFVSAHFFRLFFDPDIPILRFGRSPIAFFHVKPHIGMIWIVSVFIVVKYDVMRRSEVRAVWELLRSGLLVVTAQIAVSLPSLEWEASGIIRFDRIQSTRYSYVVFLPSPLTNDLIEERIRGNIIVSFSKDGNSGQLVVNASFLSRNAVKMMELNFCVVSNSVLGVFGRRVYVRVTKMPPLTKAFRKVYSSKTTAITHPPA